MAKKVATKKTVKKPAARKTAGAKPKSGKKDSEIRHVSAELVDSNIEPREEPTPLEPGEDLDLAPLSVDMTELPEIEGTETLDSDSDSDSDSESGSDEEVQESRTSRLPATVGSKALTTAKDPIAAYLAEIRKYPVLSREEEQKLARHYIETKDPAAAQALVTANLRFVVKIAAEYSKFGARLIDLVQEGNMGLMHAVRDFNPYKNVRLITYAVWWIRGYIQEYLMKQYSLVKIGTTQNQKKLFYRLQKEKEALDAMGENPTVALIGTRLGIPEDEVREMAQRLRGRDVSLSATIDDDSKTSLMDFQKSGEETPDQLLGREEELSILREKLEDLRPQLSERELHLLEDRLLADEPLTLQEIGEKYGITREAVRQMETRLLEKIRKTLVEIR